MELDSILESWHVLDFLGTTRIGTCASQTAPISHPQQRSTPVCAVPQKGCGSKGASAFSSKQNKIQSGNGAFDAQEQFSGAGVE